MAGSHDTRVFDIQPSHPPSKKVHLDTGKDEASVTNSKVPNGTVHGLPPMLSSTLVDSVEEGLAKMQGGKIQQAEKAKASQTTSSKVKPIINGNTSSANSRSTSAILVDNAVAKTTEKEKSPKSPTKVKVPSSINNGSTVKGGKPSNLNSNGSTSNPSAIAKETKEVTDNGSRANGGCSTSKSLDKKETKDSKRSRVVVFKIPKALRKNCQRILQMQPRPRKIQGQSQTNPLSVTHDRSGESSISNYIKGDQIVPKKSLSGAENQGSREGVSKQKAVATGPETHKTGEKRRPADEDKETSRQSSKRQRLSGADIHKPSTPVASALKSPSFLQPSSAQKSQLSTPKHNLKSTAMRRINSTEGGVQTPIGSIRGNTPTAPGSAERSNNRDARSSDASLAGNSVLTNGNNEGAMFKAEFNRYADLAKSLKRAADALLRLEDGQINPDLIVRRQGLATAIETTLCYMLAFTLKDESDRIKRLPYERAAWVSLLPYFRFLTSLIRDEQHPYLQGFLYQLEAVCREAVLHHDFERLERDPTGNDGDSISFRRSMAENGKTLAQTWAAGTRLLTVDKFQQEFPKTWGKRAEAPKASNERERLVPQHYGEGDFYVPLSSTSSVIETVRAGWSFLGEWCEKEGVHWEGKIGL